MLQWLMLRAPRLLGSRIAQVHPTPIIFFCSLSLSFLTLNKYFWSKHGGGGSFVFFILVFSLQVSQSIQLQVYFSYFSLLCLFSFQACMQVMVWIGSRYPTMMIFLDTLAFMSLNVCPLVCKFFEGFVNVSSFDLYLVENYVVPQTHWH